MTEHDAVRAAEIDLLGSTTRQDRKRLESILHPDFAEIGRSGRLLSRAAILDGLAAEAPRETPATDEWSFQDLAPHVVLVTYRLRAAGRESRHSSIWELGSGSPVIRFHQGTPAASPVAT